MEAKLTAIAEGTVTEGSAPKPAAKVLRAFAADNGITVGDRGKLPNSLYSAFEVAQRGLKTKKARSEFDAKYAV